MSRVIIFCGLPGSGKTTLAKAIAKKLNIASLHKDIYKESLYEVMEGSTLDDSKTTGRCAVEILLSAARDNIKNGVDIIIESPFNHPDNATLFHDWKSGGVAVFVIVCFVDEQERVKRTETRERHPAHHQATRPAGAIDYSGVEYDSMPNPKLFLDTSQPPEKLVEQILKFLKTEGKLMEVISDSGAERI
jgi:predicted kinase